MVKDQSDSERKEERKEMFYLRLYGVRLMVKDHSDSERGNPLLPHGLCFPISSKGCFIYAPSYKQDSTYHSLCYTSRGALAGTRLFNKKPNSDITVTVQCLFISNLLK